jgi:hypothetical protein
MSKDDMIEVTQADREAAKSILWVKTIIDDIESIEQAFARHRLSSTPPSPPAMVEVEQALEHVKFGMEIAYANGLHEFGYDPVEVLRLAVLAYAEQDKEVERLRAENEELRERGARAIIAYHVAICSPKGVVPDDSFYDPAIANHCERELSAGAQKAVDLLALTTRRCLASLTVPEPDTEVVERVALGIAKKALRRIEAQESGKDKAIGVSYSASVASIALRSIAALRPQVGEG